MNSHKIDYKIYGDDLQAVEVELDAHETVVAEAGAMNWMEDGVTFEARMGDGSNPSSGFFEGLLGIGFLWFSFDLSWRIWHIFLEFSDCAENMGASMAGISSPEWLVMF